MEAASFDLLRAGNSVTNTLSGEVRVAITEGLGTFWLAPRLVDFQQSFPNILVDLHFAMRSADVSRHEADVRSICRGPPRLMSNWSGSAEDILCFLPAKNPCSLTAPRGLLTNWSSTGSRCRAAAQTAAKEAFETLFPGRSQRDL